MPPNTPFQPTACGARDRWLFDSILCRAPWPQLNGNPFGGSFSAFLQRRCSLNRVSHKYSASDTMPTNTLAFLMDTLRRFHHAGIHLWVSGGWAEELWQMTPPRPHRDIDLL